MEEEKLLNKVPVVEIHQPKKNRDINPFFRPFSASSLKACDPDDFPNLHMFLKIAATPPVTTCECERSISTMRRLNNYMRCAMGGGGGSRLSALALMHIKYDMPVNLYEIVNLFEGLHPRMMQFTSLVYDFQQIE